MAEDSRDTRTVSRCKASASNGDVQQDLDRCMILCVPVEITRMILGKLEIQDLIAVAGVCRAWRGLSLQLDNVDLDFWWCKPNVSHELFSLWCDRFPRATRAALYAGMMPRGSDIYVEDGYVITLANKCPNLTHFTFKECLLSDKAVAYLAEHCPGLQYVNLNYCWRLSNAAVGALAAKCCGITHISLFYCTKLQDEAIKDLAIKCPGLTHVNVGGCFLLTDGAIGVLIDKCAKLQTLNVSHCWQMKVNLRTHGLNSNAF